MRFFRLLLPVVGGGLLLAGLGLVLVFNSRFQTWVVRRALADRPALGLTLGRVEAGLGGIRLDDLRWERMGAVVTVPTLEVDLPVMQAARDRSLRISRLVAQGWTADLSRSAVALAPNVPTAAGAATPAPANSAAVPDPGAGRPAPDGAVGAPGTGRAFAGVLNALGLPCDLSLDGVKLAGEVILPDTRGRTKLLVSGGGFAVGREGEFILTLDAAVSDPRVEVVGLKAVIRSRLDGPRSLGSLDLKFDATARGPKFPNGVAMAGSATAVRGNAGESYALSLATHGREILSLQSEFHPGASRLEGRWKVNMRDAEVAPFALGVVLPAFSVAGDGAVESDPGFTAVRVEGTIAAEGEHLEVLRPELAVLGKLKLDAVFDLAGRGGVLAVQKLNATLGAAEPVATVRALQPFEFNPASGELRAADAKSDLVGVSLHGLPVAWANPFLGSVVATGSTVRGEIVGLPRGGGVVIRSTGPVSIGQLAVAIGKTPAVNPVEVAGVVSFDYNPRGWQGEVEGLTVRAAGGEILKLEAKAGRLAGENQPLRCTGKVSAQLPPLLAQPMAPPGFPLTAGQADVEFAASLGALREFHARINLQGLAARAEPKPKSLPGFSADVRADVTADGRIGFSAPMLIQAGTRQSDATVSGTLRPTNGRFGTVEASLNSNQFIVDDAKEFLALLPGAAPEVPPPSASAPAARRNAPPWAGIDGSVTLRLREVTYSDSVRVSNVAGRILLDAGKVKLEGVQVGLGESGRANLDGTLTFDAGETQPYGLVADLAVKDFDPAPLLQSAATGRRATVEGKFEILSQLTSRAGSLDELATGAGGEFRLTSKGGTFRGLPASFASPVANTGRVAGLIAAAGSALGGLTGKKEHPAIASKPQAVAEFAANLNAIVFDQLSVAVSRDVARNATLREFTLISPEVRLSGSGSILHKPGSALLDDSLAMEFSLRARGRSGELLKYLGAVESTPDELGYLTCTVPIRIGGTLGNPDAGDLNLRLASLALEKSGVTEKASELFNKLIGGSK